MKTGSIHDSSSVASGRAVLPRGNKNTLPVWRVHACRAPTFTSCSGSSAGTWLGFCSSAASCSCSSLSAALSWPSTNSLKVSRSLFPLYCSFCENPENPIRTPRSAQREWDELKQEVRLRSWFLFVAAVPSARCGRKGAWDIPSRRSQSRPRSAAYSPPAAQVNTPVSTESRG